MRRPEAHVGLLLEAVTDDAIDGWRHGSVQRELGCIFTQNRRHRFRSSLSLKRAPAGDHLVEESAERKNVGPPVHGCPAHLLRRHIADGSQHCAGLGRTGERRRDAGSARNDGRVVPSETKVEDLHAVVGGDEDVLRLQVAMDDAFVVGGREAARDLDGVVNGASQRQWSVRERLAHGLAHEQLHHGVAHAVRAAEVMNRENVRM